MPQPKPNPILEQSLASSVLSYMRYDYRTGVLVLTFTSGRQYDYRVPPGVAEGLAKAESAGAYFNAHIKG